MSIPVNTMGYYDEESQKWIPIDAVGLKSENNRYTADDIKSLDDIKIDNDNHIYSSAKERINSDFLKINEKVDQLDKNVDNKIANLEEIINESSSSLNKKIYFKNALSYGADPTGEKASAEAIQKALDEIHNEGGGQLFIPGGKYLIEKRMFVYENTRVTMAQNCILLRGWAGGFFSNGTPTDKFKGYSGRGNIIIEGGILDGNYANFDKYPTNAMDSIILGHAKNISIDNVTFKDTISAHAIDANGCDNLRITNNKFTGFIDLTGQRNYSEAIQLGEFIEIGLNQFGEFDATPNTNVYIAHNYFGKSKLLGGWGCAIGNHYTVYDVFQSNITIFNNVIEDCGFAGVRTFKWNNVKIKNNMFIRNKECVRISQAGGGIESSKNTDGVQMNRPQNGQNVLIEGNDFYDYASSGVVAFGQIYNKEIAWNDEIRISGNYFKLKGKEIGKYNDEQAIKLVFARNVFVNNNKIYGGRRGLWVEGCFNTFISGNGVSNVDTEAVYLAKSRDTSSTVVKSYHVSIDRNEINTTGRNGIFVQKCDHFDVRDNNVLNNNKEQGSGRGRGGIYVENGYDGRIEGNRIRGVEKEFAILVEAEATEVNVANTKGTGRIIVLGESSFNGYYGTNKDDYIRKITTKSES
ncbi:right-handed parallel beta-helix repeat-containing protein [Bacillus sp. SG20033]|uniref:right-handed parallel beta-helix repeat-containing protein n=1 Tax=Bacillus sp. SG20033 TaxID=3366583 RepID=UPI0037C602D9